MSLSDLDPKVVADYLVKLGCLEEVETITVTVDTNAESHVFQMETRKNNSVLDLKLKLQDRLGFPVGDQLVFMLPRSPCSSGAQQLMEVNRLRQEPLKNEDLLTVECSVSLLLQSECCLLLVSVLLLLSWCDDCRESDCCGENLNLSWCGANLSCCGSNLKSSWCGANLRWCLANARWCGANVRCCGSNLKSSWCGANARRCGANVRCCGSNLYLIVVGSVLRISLLLIDCRSILIVQTPSSYVGGCCRLSTVALPLPLSQ